MRRTGFKKMVFPLALIGVLAGCGSGRSDSPRDAVSSDNVFGPGEKPTVNPGGKKWSGE